MSNWKEILGSKLVAPEAAVSGLSSGDKVACGLTEPTDLLKALAKREDIRDVMVVDAVLVFGGAPGYTPDLVRLAKERGLPLIAEIDATMPYTFSNQQVPVEAITCAIECSGPPEGGDVPALASDKSGAIAVYLNPLVPDGATLQVGIGSVPDAAVSLLVDKKDLGIHTEVLNEGLIELMEAGVATGARKSLHPGKAVCTISAISDKIGRFVDRNPDVLVMSSREALNPVTIAKNPAVRCINSAFQADLLGQGDAETLGGFQVAG